MLYVVELISTPDYGWCCNTFNFVYCFAMKNAICQNDMIYCLTMNDMLWNYKITALRNDTCLFKKKNRMLFLL